MCFLPVCFFQTKWHRVDKMSVSMETVLHYATDKEFVHPLPSSGHPGFGIATKEKWIIVNINYWMFVRYRESQGSVAQAKSSGWTISLTRTSNPRACGLRLGLYNPEIKKRLKHLDQGRWNGHGLTETPWTNSFDDGLTWCTFDPVANCSLLRTTEVPLGTESWLESSEVPVQWHHVVLKWQIREPLPVQSCSAGLGIQHSFCEGICWGGPKTGWNSRFRNEGFEGPNAFWHLLTRYWDAYRDSDGFGYVWIQLLHCRWMEGPKPVRSCQCDVATGRATKSPVAS